ncbi:MAG: 23S rRNA (pseudouridine(1915)-N(3))-methyltransferase RlmH [Patescibacteria group bacterium]
MFSVTLINVAESKGDNLKSFESEYRKRLAAFCNFVTETVKGSDIKKDGEGILKKIKDGDAVVLLDERGTEYTSVGFADFISKEKDHGAKLVFIIGGAYGVSDSVKARANFKIALSKMTFPHQLVRVFFLEQLYRAFTITAGRGYHH